MRRAFVILLCIFSLFVKAQTLSSVVYPQATCNAVTCPAFTSVKSHITASYVDTLTETLYVGGVFRQMQSTTRRGLAAINGATGTLLSFNVNVDTTGCVYAIAKVGDTLFIGGRFSKVNNVARVNFAAIRISTGALLPSFALGVGTTSDTVFAINYYRNRIYIGGRFNTVFGQSRTNIAKVSRTGAVLTGAPNPGIVRKISSYNARIVAIADVVGESSVIRIDTNFASGFATIFSTTQSTSAYPQYVQDFAIRGDSVYVVGTFFCIDNVISTYYNFVASNINTGVERTWGVHLPVGSSYNLEYSPKNHFRIEYYRDSLYVGVRDGEEKLTNFHKLVVFHYRGNQVRILKTYPSNQPGLQGNFFVDLLIGNARMYEIDKYALHTAFPNGSHYCNIYSWCLQIPATPATALGPPTVCPDDTNWYYMPFNAAYSTYTWYSTDPNLILTPNGDSCRAITTPVFVYGQVRVRGQSSCNILTVNESVRTVTDFPLPSVNAGSSDSLTCSTTMIVQHGSCIPAPVSWIWSGPAASNADSVYVTVPGTYILQCVSIDGCRGRDTVQIGIDTIPPPITPYGSVPQLTCVNTSIQLNAASLYPGDSLRWTTGTGSFPNPVTITQPGSVFLTVVDLNNGCNAQDTISVAQNVVQPTGASTVSDTLFTCAVDSILLTATSPGPNVVFIWMDASLMHYPNPFYAIVSGAYSAMAIDTLNGCVTTLLPEILNSWTTPPNLTLPSDSFNITCSSDSALLVANSLTTSATFLWTDSSSFTGGNPSYVTTQGVYYCVLTDTLNGCVTVDSAYVGFTPLLLVNGVNDTAICNGSGAVLNVTPVGGTSPFQYAWNNGGGNSALVTVYPSDTLQYIVAVVDGVGCSGFDTVVVNVPDPISDSVLSFQPCDPNQPTGQIQIYPSGGAPPFQYSSDNGLTWQPSNIFPGLTYGNYQFVIQDALGCTHTTTGDIDTNSLSPSPDFIVSTSPELGDTIVLVDISNPRPDSVVWDFPLGTVVTDSSMYAPVIVPADTGNFTMTMHAWYGTCEVVYTRLINIHPFDSLGAQPWRTNAIDSLIVYPNPNSGTFTTLVHLQSKQNFVILVTDANGLEHSRVQVSDADEWTGTISVSNPVPGNYILRVIAEYDTAAIPFVISQ